MSEAKAGSTIGAAGQAQESGKASTEHGSHVAKLALGALGVVYGDIGTSPIYAVRESALAAGRHVPVQSAIMGVVSLIVWSLIIVVTLKYVFLIMRADNDGEGGVLALASMAHRSNGLGRKTKFAIGTAAILGLALFIGDGMLTPAISVLSAVEGLSVESKSFEPLIMPLVLVILVGLFAIQARGTAIVGKMFGPVMRGVSGAGGVRMTGCEKAMDPVVASNRVKIPVQ